MLVVLVVFLTLRNARAALVPSVAVPLSLIGTFGAMYLLGFSLDNLSLMALTVATGFVVDDAIVVLENISRHIEAGMPRFEAALQGAREVGFTVLAMSLSLIAVFLPILLMGGIVGRTFREFALTLSVAILISLVVSLTTTPMMCAHVLRRGSARQGRFMSAHGARLRRHARLLRPHAARRAGASAHRDAACWPSTVALNFYLLRDHSQGLLPAAGHRHADRAICAPIRASRFRPWRRSCARVMSIVQADPAVQDVVGFTGGGGGGPAAAATNTANMFVGLKPLSQRKLSERPRHRAAARQAGQHHRRAPVPAGHPGHPRRRPPEQLAVPVHHPQRTT